MVEEKEVEEEEEVEEEVEGEEVEKEAAEEEAKEVEEEEVEEEVEAQEVEEKKQKENRTAVIYCHSMFQARGWVMDIHCSPEGQRRQGKLRETKRHTWGLVMSDDRARI